MSEKVNVDDLVGILHTPSPSMCSVCLVREQRDGDEFIPCSPECYQAALRSREAHARAVDYDRTCDLMNACLESGSPMPMIAFGLLYAQLPQLGWDEVMRRAAGKSTN